MKVKYCMRLSTFLSFFLFPVFFLERSERANEEMRALSTWALPLTSAQSRQSARLSSLHIHGAAMAAMAALQASTTAMAASHTKPASMVAGARVRCFSVNQGALSALRATGVDTRCWRGRLVAVRAQVEKSSVRERSVEEKDRDLAASRVSFQDQHVEEPADPESDEYDAAPADYSEVSKILASRVEDGQTQYLIEWKDDHLESWEPADNIARFALHPLFPIPSPMPFHFLKNRHSIAETWYSDTRILGGKPPRKLRTRS
jgi:hypothetical protein